MNSSIAGKEIKNVPVLPDTILLVEAYNRQTFVIRDELRAFEAELKNTVAQLNEVRESINSLADSVAYSLQEMTRVVSLELKNIGDK